jgi:AraC-like DNA-binding protein
MIKKYDFFKTKYGDELLIDLIRLESLEKYITEKCPHYLTYYDITLLTGGKGNFCIDQYQYDIQPGTVLFSSPGQVRHWNIESLPKGYVLIFEEEFLMHFLNDLQFISDLKYFNNRSNPPQIHLSAADLQYLIQIMKNIEQEVSTFNRYDQYILQALLYQILVWLNRKYSALHLTTNTENNNRYISLFSKLVNQNFNEQHSVSFYAEKLNITAGHLNDLSKLHLGTNAKQFIQNRIMLQAKRMLLYTNLQVEEIALQLSFENTTYFIRKFKNETGLTPLAFRKNKIP